MVFPLGFGLLPGLLGINMAFWLPFGVVSIIPGATLLPIEHFKHIDRKTFAHGVMLPEEPHKIGPQKEFNWLMLIPANKYESHFTITCTDKHGLVVSVFDVTN